MGCNSSKPLVETSDYLLRSCRSRRLHIKHAIEFRQQFAAAHTAYIHSLKEVGFALKCFTGVEFSETDVSSQRSSNPVLALPPPSSSSLGDLSPPHDSDLNAVILSPPHSRPEETQDVRLALPPKISMSPPLSPMRLPVGGQSGHSQSSALADSRAVSPQESSPLTKTSAITVRSRSLDSSMPLRAQSFSSVISPDRGSEFSQPYFSPTRDDLDDALVAYCPPPPSSLIADTTWFNHDEFTPPVIPRHLQEQRRMKRATDLERKDEHGPGKAEVEEADVPELEDSDYTEDIPELEESVHQDAHSPSFRQNDVPAASASHKDELMMDGAIPAEAGVRGVLNSTSDNSVAKANQDESMQDSLLKTVNQDESMQDSLLKTRSLPQKSADSQTLGGGGLSGMNSFSVPVLKEKTLSEAIRYINQLSVQAYKCGQDVSRMLETQMHNKPRAADSLKPFDSITSPLSTKRPYLAFEDVDEGDHVLECGMSGSHASTLERLFAWERKLHSEVKEGGMLRISFDRKFKELHIWNAQGGDHFVRDRLKAIIKKLDTRLSVAMTTIRATSSRVEKLANDELYPQLCELLEGLTSMWRRMALCHQAQTEIASELQTFEGLIIEIEATEPHKRATAKLKQTLLKLKTDFQFWLWSQSKYIVELNEWGQRCYEFKDACKEPVKEAPILRLLNVWKTSIENLSPDINVNGIKEFIAAIRSLEDHHFIELKSKRQADKSTRRLSQETLFLDKLERTNTESKRASLIFSPSRLLRIPSARKMPRKRARLDKYKTRAELEKHDYLTAVESGKNRTVDLIQQELPSLFHSWFLFAEEAERMYETVKEKAEEISIPDTALVPWKRT